MAKLLKAVLTGMVFSGYYFPFEFTFLPGINTKIILAVVGMVLLAMHWLKERNTEVNTVFVFISIVAGIFSLFSLFSVTYNNTTDYTYASYIFKMWVWLSGAYSTLYLIRQVHGEVTVRWIFHYMAWVCAVQSILGIVIDNIPVIQGWIDANILQDTDFFHKTKRLYGIGAAFDTAGIRFSCALLGLGYLLTHISGTKKTWYWGLFIVISVLGNIMSRTTTVGLVIAVLYMTLINFSLNVQLNTSKMRFINITIVVIGLLAGVTFYGYHHSPTLRYYLQYGFEGFFNWYQNGTWETSSTIILQKMIVLPDNLKTWLIGDGWFDDPNHPGTFYKYTDVGYLRFIFYCGSIGLSLFISFFICCTAILSRKWKEDKLFLSLLFLLELIVWTKISTDIFLVYAPLLLLDRYAPAQDSIKYSKQLAL